MKQFAAIFLILLILLQTMNSMVVKGIFLLQQKWIAKNTCENRFRPELKCGGKCVLMKKLKQQEEQEDKQPASLKIETSGFIISSKSFFATLTLRLQQLGTLKYPQIIKSGIPVDRSYSFFHPPQQSA